MNVEFAAVKCKLTSTCFYILLTEYQLWPELSIPTLNLILSGTTLGLIPTVKIILLPHSPSVTMRQNIGRLPSNAKPHQLVTWGIIRHFTIYLLNLSPSLQINLIAHLLKTLTFFSSQDLKVALEIYFLYINIVMKPQ